MGFVNKDLDKVGADIFLLAVVPKQRSLELNTIDIRSP